MTCACGCGQFSAVWCPVEHGANVNAFADSWLYKACGLGGNVYATPLVCALEAGRVDIAQYLIDNGADINQGRNIGYTLLYMAYDKLDRDTDHWSSQSIDFLRAHGVVEFYTPAKSECCIIM